MERSSPRAKTQAIREFRKYINLTQTIFLGTVDLDIIEGYRHGVFVHDLGTDKQYIDCFCSAGSFNVGRINPEMIEAVNRALDDYDIGDCDLMSAPRAALAVKLAEITPAGLNHVAFAAGGGEMNDIAIKMARGATGRPGVISMLKAYHGHTGFSLSAIGKPVYRDPFEPLMQGFVQVPFNDLDAVDKAAGADTAAIILEIVQGEGGIHIATQEFLTGLRRICDERGIVLIFDEIQTGLGRTGRMFCCEHYGVTPDILTLAKSIGGALYPLAAAVYNDRLYEFMRANPDAIRSTTGGSDIGCVVALQVIDYLQKNHVPEHAAEMGEYIGAGIEKLAVKHKKLLKEVRRKGLMIGLEYTHDMMGPLMSFFLSLNGVVAVFSGNNPKVMRFMPPLVISREEADRLLDAMDKSMTAVVRSSDVVRFASGIPLIGNAINIQEMQVGIIAVVRAIRKIIPFS